MTLNSKAAAAVYNCDSVAEACSSVERSGKIDMIGVAYAY